MKTVTIVTLILALGVSNYLWSAKYDEKCAESLKKAQFEVLKAQTEARKAQTEAELAKGYLLTCRKGPNLDELREYMEDLERNAERKGLVERRGTLPEQK
jgi:hypothetical protein